jgi:hypothetical protein
MEVWFVLQDGVGFSCHVNRRVPGYGIGSCTVSYRLEVLRTVCLLAYAGTWDFDGLGIWKILDDLIEVN